MLQRYVNHDSKINVIQPRGTATAKLFDSPSNLDPNDEKAQPKVLWLCLLRMWIGGIEEIFEVFLSLPNYRLS